MGLAPAAHSLLSAFERQNRIATPRNWEALPGSHFCNWNSIRSNLVRIRSTFSVPLGLSNPHQFLVSFEFNALALPVPPSHTDASAICSGEGIA